MHKIHNTLLVEAKLFVWGHLVYLFFWCWFDFLKIVTFQVTVPMWNGVSIIIYSNILCRALGSDMYKTHLIDRNEGNFNCTSWSWQKESKSFWAEMLCTGSDLWDSCLTLVRFNSNFWNMEHEPYSTWYWAQIQSFGAAWKVVVFSQDRMTWNLDEPYLLWYLCDLLSSLACWRWSESISFSMELGFLLSWNLVEDSLPSVMLQSEQCLLPSLYRVLL